MSKYNISSEQAKLLAVGIYQNVGAWVAAAKLNNPDDYESFKAEYLAKQAVKASEPVKRRKSRNRIDTS